MITTDLVLNHLGLDFLLILLGDLWIWGCELIEELIGYFGIVG